MLQGPLPPGFEREVVVIRPGCRRTYRASDWRDAIVLVDQGQVLVEREGRAGFRFGPGHLLCLGGLGVQAIYNPGPEPAVLISVKRRPQQETEAT
jgi:hypothetical protein